MWVPHHARYNVEVKFEPMNLGESVFKSARDVQVNELFIAGQCPVDKTQRESQRAGRQCSYALLSAALLDWPGSVTAAT